MFGITVWIMYEVNCNGRTWCIWGFFWFFWCRIRP